MRPVRTRARRRGFTLIEVMIAATVLALVFVSSLAAIGIGYRFLEDARMSTLASQVLQSEMENLRLKNWTQLSGLPASEPFQVQTAMSHGFNAFSCTRTIADAGADMKRVELALSWTTMNGRAQTRRYITFIAREGLNDYYYRRF